MGSKMWVSCREPGKVTEGSDLTKSAGGRLEQSDHCDFAVTGQTSVRSLVGGGGAEPLNNYMETFWGDRWKSLCSVSSLGVHIS